MCLNAWFSDWNLIFTLCSSGCSAAHNLSETCDIQIWSHYILFITAILSFYSVQVSSQSKLLVPERLDHSQLDQTVSEIWSQGKGPAHTEKQGTQHIIVALFSIMSMN